MKKLGRDYRLWVESATPGTYNEIKGNQELSIQRDGGTIDTSTKSDFPYGSAAPGGRSVTVQAGFVPDLPDANGYTRFMTQANAAVSTPINLQIRKGGSSGGTPDVVFECAMYASQINDDFGQGGPVSSSWTLVNAAPPTVDTLA